MQLRGLLNLQHASIYSPYIRFYRSDHPSKHYRISRLAPRLHHLQCTHKCLVTHLKSTSEPLPRYCQDESQPAVRSDRSAETPAPSRLAYPEAPESPPVLRPETVRGSPPPARPLRRRSRCWSAGCTSSAPRHETEAASVCSTSAHSADGYPQSSASPRQHPTHPSSAAPTAPRGASAPSRQEVLCG